MHPARSSEGLGIVEGMYDLEFELNGTTRRNIKPLLTPASNIIHTNKFNLIITYYIIFDYFDISDIITIYETFLCFDNGNVYHSNLLIFSL